MTSKASKTAKVAEKLNFDSPMMDGQTERVKRSYVRSGRYCKDPVKAATVLNKRKHASQLQDDDLKAIPNSRGECPHLCTVLVNASRISPMLRFFAYR